MLEFHADQFERLSSSLGAINAFCNEEGKKSDKAIPEIGKSDVLQRLNELEVYCKDLSLDSALAQIRRVRARIAKSTYSSLSQGLEDLHHRLMHELKQRFFIFIPNDKAEYYRDQTPFGSEVTEKWPETAYDIEEASKCFATGRYTATVFHLMRVMEFGVQKLGKFARIRWPVRERDKVWGNFLVLIKKKLDAMNPKGTETKKRKLLIQEIAAYLHHVKDVWRNQTMHPKKTYTEEEAKWVFLNAKRFIQHLAKNT